MKVQSDIPAPPLRKTRAAALGVVLTLSLIGILFLFLDVQQTITTRYTASSDTGQWTLAQTDVEFLTFRDAVAGAEMGRQTLEDVRKRYDVFYSRVMTLKAGKIFALLHKDPGFADNFQKILAWLIKVQPLIDGPDAQLRAGLASLQDGSHDLRPNVRNVALEGLRAFAAISDAERKRVADTLVAAGALTLSLILVLLSLVVILLVMDRNTRLMTAEKLETLDRLQAIIATALDAVIVMDGRGQIVEFNGSAAEVFGVPRDAALGRDMVDVIIPATERALYPDGKSLYRAAEDRRLSNQGRLRLTARHATGRLFPIEGSITRVASKGQDLFVAFLRDLSNVVASEQALMKARDDALAGERAKAKLLAVMSHEMRTPLNGMIGMIELLDETEMNPKQRDYLGVMQISGRLLIHHVEDVLNIAQLETGHMPNQTEWFDLAALIDEVFANQRPAAIAQGNTLTLVRPATDQTMLNADPFQLRQVLMNLIGNAIKFTRDGQIRLEFTSEPLTGTTLLRVVDTGIGIDPADHDRVFEDFVILDTTYSRRVGGTGLGLGITRRIVQNMGGEIWVESVLGQGSSFVLRLPGDLAGRQAQEATQAPPEVPEPVLPMHVLVVEDNAINRLVVREMLVRLGHVIEVAHDGTEAVHLAGLTRYDLILMDISMPRMDGVEATLAIRSGGGKSAQSPIIALTAHALSDEVARFRAAGMQDVLVKPMTGRALAAVLARVGSRTVDAGLLAEVMAGMGPARGPRLLVAFLQDSDAGLAKVQVMLDRRADLDEIRREIHKLCGSTAIFGARLVSEALQEAEELCRTGDHTDVADAMTGVGKLWAESREIIRASAPALQGAKAGM